MKKNKNISKKKMFLIIILFTILLILLSLLFAPSLIEGMETKKLENEVENVNKMIETENINIKELKNYTKKNITSGKRKKVEKSIENYLIDLGNNTNTIIEIKNDKVLINSLNVKKIETNEYDFSKTKESLSESKKKLETSLENLSNLSQNKIDYIKENTNNKELIDLYKKLLSNDKYIDKYTRLSNTLLNNINITTNLIEYLEKNKEYWKIEDNKFIFLKRNKLNEFQTLYDKIQDKLNQELSELSLIKDEKGPNINAENITITEGTSINIKEKIKCTDDVDDEVECKISGEYDTNKPGDYKISIESTDKSNNTSKKEIILKVNKKIVYKKPYYIEVIRNQNTVIVYGLDDNNEYTKILRVMPCSVGREGQETPTGTFTTERGYEWGELYGHVFGQYSTRIVSDILFHSVPYYSTNKWDLEWEEYNKLGSPASLGCVRMTVRDVKWIFENCGSGITVKIYDGNLPSGVTKPTAPKIDGTSPNKGWDPTDPDPNNPWNH